jgi:hypothetical protein
MGVEKGWVDPPVPESGEVVLTTDDPEKEQEGSFGTLDTPPDNQSNVSNDDAEKTVED